MSVAEALKDLTLVCDQCDTVYEGEADLVMTLKGVEEWEKSGEKYSLPTVSPSGCPNINCKGNLILKIKNPTKKPTMITPSDKFLALKRIVTNFLAEILQIGFSPPEVREKLEMLKEIVRWVK